MQPGVWPQSGGIESGGIERGAISEIYGDKTARTRVVPYTVEIGGNRCEPLAKTRLGGWLSSKRFERLVFGSFLSRFRERHTLGKNNLFGD